ncbi:SGNH/GDSL hydrolase family protein [uncultured Enterococcus sp.]|uniref:SGNH/GDSL hydrolase family protein n=1 Tax=uncultured Enterococcus sp. TaxID=167972 RepID=UPI0028055518|nr:SGNH/GDSL hydrolase family protein [uncultured Enterococcus sp.]
MALSLDKFRDVDLVIDKANDNFIQRQFVSQADYRGRTLTVQVTNNGEVGEIPGLFLNLRWQNQSAGNTDLTAFKLIDKENSVFRIEYPQHMMTPGKVVANIQVIQNGTALHMKSFELTVQKLAGEAVGIVEKAEYSALVAVLSDANKFRTDIDTLDVVKATKESLDSAIKELNNKISNIPKGSPSGTYDTLAALKAAYPKGNANTYVVTSDGKWYYWSGADWVAGGIYQAVGLADGDVTTTKIADEAVTRKKIEFQDVSYKTNIATSDNFIADQYYNLSGNLLKKGDAGYSAGWGMIKLFPVEPGDSLYRNKYVSWADGSACFLTFFGDEEGNQFVSSVSWSLTSATVPEGANYASVSAYEPRYQNAVVTKNEVIGFVDKEFVVDFSNLSKAPYSGPQAAITSSPHMNDYVTLDFLKKELRIKKTPGFIIWNSNYKWVHGGPLISAEEDLVFTFDEIEEAVGYKTYAYLYVKRNLNADVKGKELFEFTGPTGFADDYGPITGDRMKNYSNLIFIGAFHLVPSYNFWHFPDTNIKVISSNEDYEHKMISFLGDSITTYAGWIPSQNATYFPKNYMNDVNRAWWKQLIDKSNRGLELLVNNSWSGSRVTDTAGVESSGVDRATKLHTESTDPDVIIVYIGINDFNNNIELGDYDGTTDVPEITNKFSEAYAVMLDKISEQYPLAKVFCCTMPFNSRGGFPRQNSFGLLEIYNERIRRISKVFGCEVIDFDEIGLNKNTASSLLGDGLHPNEYGMDALAEKAIRVLNK